MVMADSGPIDTSAFAGVHLYKAMMQIARLDFLKSSNAIFYTVYCEVCKITLFSVHAF